MRLETAFRLSTYLTLGLACLCLGYAEYPFLPEIAAFGGVTAVLLVLAFLAEGRWSLTIRAANLLAAVIALGGGSWVVYHVVQGTDSWLVTTPWPAAGLPYVGPILMLLISALVFRPKRPVEIWWLHGIGLMALALGCSMADDSVFGVLVLVYLACGLWSLAMFCLYRESVGSAQWAVGSQRALDVQKKNVVDGRLLSSSSLPTAHCPLPTIPWRSLGLARTGRWAAAVLVLGMLLFLCTPRRGHTHWQLALSRTPHMQTGLPGAMVDLNRVGVVEIDDEPAFEVRAENAAGKPKLDLDPQQRWRGMGMVFNDYHKGQWASVQPQASPPPGTNPLQAAQSRPGQLPNLGKQQFFLTMNLNLHQARGIYLAEPLILRSNQPPPVVTLDRDGKTSAWHLTPNGGVQPPMTSLTGSMQYRQVTIPSPKPGESRISDPLRLDVNQHQLMPVPGIAAWTQELLDRLVAQGKLAPADLDKVPNEGQWLLPKNHEKVARVLEAHLASPGEFEYSLDLKRQNWDLDPTEDFLRNVKRGHCDRFATALALMLRSLGVPTRLVMGFRGCDAREDGNYLVRHSHAHAWVEALIRRVKPGRETTSHWLTLDPTPDRSSEQDAGAGAGYWWETLWYSSQSLWKSHVIEYNADQQETAATELWERLGGDKIAAGFGNPSDRFGRLLRSWPAYGLGILSVGLAYLAGLWLVRRGRHRRGAASMAARSPLVVFYARLLEVLAQRCGLQPRPPQTPREFAATATAALAATLPVAALAVVPKKVVQLYYRVRFGHQPLEESERTAIEQEITRLDAALANPNGDVVGVGPAPAGG